MELTGETTIEAAPETVWKTVSDPEALVECIPGADEVERVSDEEYTGTITKSVAGIGVKLDGTVELTELEPHEFMAATTTATDNRSGTWTKLTGSAEMELIETDEGTAVDYVITIDVSGRLASRGAHLVKPTVRSDVDAFFDAVAEQAES
ncbi:CoxG family protein [Natrialbaceae archaeon A-arb3/5]